MAQETNPLSREELSEQLNTRPSSSDTNYILYLVDRYAEYIRRRCAYTVLSKYVVHGDHYGAYSAPSNDSEDLSEYIMDLDLKNL